MPYRDKTGPDGKGPKTGRGLGDCDVNTDVDNDPRLKKMVNWRLFRNRRRRPSDRRNGYGRRPMDGSGPNPGHGVGMGGEPQGRNRR